MIASVVKLANDQSLILSFPLLTAITSHDAEVWCEALVIGAEG